MAVSDATLLGVIQFADQNLADIDVSDLLQGAPMVRRLTAVRASQGAIVHNYAKQTVAAGATFRDVNTGVANSAGSEELVTVTLEYLDGHFNIDEAVAKGTGDVDGYLAMRVRKSIASVFTALEAQALQGVLNGDSDGFQGYPDSSFVANLDKDMVVDAGGDGDESVWMLRTDQENVAVIAGSDGVLDFDGSITKGRTVTNTTTNAGYISYSASISMYLGIQFGSQFSLGRIANLDNTTSNKLTDDMLHELYSKFPRSIIPNMIVMSRREHKNLMQSRTATTPDGTPVQLIEVWNGIPIVISDQIGSDETALVTTTTTTTTTSA